MLLFPPSVEQAEFESFHASCSPNPKCFFCSFFYCSRTLPARLTSPTSQRSWLFGGCVWHSSLSDVASLGCPITTVLFLLLDCASFFFVFTYGVCRKHASRADWGLQDQKSRAARPGLIKNRKSVKAKPPGHYPTKKYAAQLRCEVRVANMRAAHGRVPRAGVAGGEWGGGEGLHTQYEHDGSINACRFGT